MECDICPRNCRAERGETGGGVCGMGAAPVVAKAMLHMWEEPCISGQWGSGAVFFSGCPLGCVYCQNGAISRGGVGKPVTSTRLREIYFELIDKGAHNINLVSPTHFAGAVIESLAGGLPVPVVWNTGGYESVRTLRRLEGLVRVYLPDMKYALPETARKYSAAPDYPGTAKAAILEMFRQTGRYRLGDDGMIRSGVVVRHLILPGNLENTFRVIDWVADAFPPGGVLFSLMSQYTPFGDLEAFPELGRRLEPDEYAAAMEYMQKAGIEDGFYQELSSAEEEYVPDFDLDGV